MTTEPTTTAPIAGIDHDITRTRAVYLGLRAALIDRLGAGAVVETEHGPDGLMKDDKRTQLVDTGGTLCLKHHRSAGWGEHVSLRHNQWTLTINAGEYRMPGFPLTYQGDTSPLGVEMFALAARLVQTETDKRRAMLSGEPLFRRPVKGGGKR